MITPLKFYRLNQGIRLGDLAIRAGVSSSLVSKIESGEIMGSSKTRAKIAEVLGVSERNLFGGK